jgi:AAA domain
VAARAGFITLADYTKPMMVEAVKEGFHQTLYAKFPMIQILTIGELLSGKQPNIPLIHTSMFILSGGRRSSPRRTAFRPDRYRGPHESHACASRTLGQLAREESCPAIAVVMSTSEELCRERNAQREGARRVSDERMERMFAALEPVRPDEGFAAVHFESGVGPGIGVAEILSAKELFHEYCHEAR